MNLHILKNYIAIVCKPHISYFTTFLKNFLKITNFFNVKVTVMIFHSHLVDVDSVEIQVFFPLSTLFYSTLSTLLCSVVLYTQHSALFYSTLYSVWISGTKSLASRSTSTTITKRTCVLWPLPDWCIMGNEVPTTWQLRHAPGFILTLYLPLSSKASQLLYLRTIKNSYR